MKKTVALIIFTFFIVSSSSFAAMEAAKGYSWVRAAQTAIDEAFYGLNNPSNVYDPYYRYGVEPDSVANIPGSQPKRNATYAWGVTEVGDEIWYGVMNNAWCGWMVSHLRLAGPDGMNFVTEHQACGGQSVGTQLYIYNTSTNKITTIDPSTFKNPALADEYNFYFNDTATAGPRVRAAGNLNGVVFFAGQYTENQGTDNQKDFEILFAFDAATKEYLGSAKLPYNSTRRLNVITDSKGNKALYVFFGADTTTAGLGKCRSVMFRWVGTKENPFRGGTKLNNNYEIDDANGTIETGWELVYTFPIVIGAPGEFVQFTDKEGGQRIIVSTWATAPETIKWWWDDVATDAEKGAYGNVMPETQAGTILMSSPIPDGGFTVNNKPTYTEMMNMSEFEVDPLVAKGYELGAMEVFGDYLVWGTMHVGLSAGYKRYIEAGYKELDEYEYILPPGLSLCGTAPGPTCVPDAFAAYVAIDANLNPNYNKTFASEALRNTWRAMTLFRTKLDFSGADAGSVENLKSKMFANTELLYGSAKEKVLSASATPQNNIRTWEEKPNLRGWTPKFGAAGLGNIMNVYTWTMHKYNGRLYIGTFDLSGGMDDFTLEAWKPNYSDGTIKYEGVKPSMLQLLDYAREVNENTELGADFFVMDSPDSPARIVTINGFGNKWNNGVRNAAVVGNKFFAGTSTYSVLSPDGGLEFYQVSDGSGSNDSGSSSGGCSIGGGSDKVLAALILCCLGILAIRRIRKA